MPVMFPDLSMGYLDIDYTYTHRYVLGKNEVSVTFLIRIKLLNSSFTDATHWHGFDLNELLGKGIGIAWSIDVDKYLKDFYSKALVKRPEITAAIAKSQNTSELMNNLRQVISGFKPEKPLSNFGKISVLIDAKELIWSTRIDFN
jgi:hypothetical protein